MQTAMKNTQRANKAQWSGRFLSALVVLFLLFDGAIKVIQFDEAVKTMVQLGYHENVVFGLGVITLIIVVLYAIPRTAFLGAILLTGLLGGAMATQLRVGNPI